MFSGARFTLGLHATSGKEIKTLLDHPQVGKMKDGSPLPSRLQDRISQSTMCGFESSPCIYDTDNTGYALTSQGWEHVLDMKRHSVCGQQATATFGYQQQLACAWKGKEAKQGQAEQKDQKEQTRPAPPIAPTSSIPRIPTSVAHPAQTQVLSFSNQDASKMMVIMGILFVAFLISQTSSISHQTPSPSRMPLSARRKATARKIMTPTQQRRHPAHLE